MRAYVPPPELLAAAAFGEAGEGQAKRLAASDGGKTAKVCVHSRDPNHSSLLPLAAAPRCCCFWNTSSISSSCNSDSDSSSSDSRPGWRTVTSCLFEKQHPEANGWCVQAAKAGKKSSPKATAKKVKDPNAPKRPTSGYFYFAAASRAA